MTLPTLEPISDSGVMERRERERDHKHRILPYRKQAGGSCTQFSQGTTALSQPTALQFWLHGPPGEQTQFLLSPHKGDLSDLKEASDPFLTGASNPLYKSKLALDLVILFSPTSTAAQTRGNIRACCIRACCMLFSPCPGRCRSTSEAGTTLLLCHTNFQTTKGYYL